MLGRSNEEGRFLAAIAEMNNNGVECFRRGALQEATQNLINALVQGRRFLTCRSGERDEPTEVGEPNVPFVIRRSDSNYFTFQDLQECFFTVELQRFLAEGSSNMIIEEPILITKVLLEDGDLEVVNHDLILSTSIAVVLFNISLLQYRRERIVGRLSTRAGSKSGVDSPPKYAKSKALLENAVELLFSQSSLLGRQGSQPRARLVRGFVLMAVFNNLIQMTDRSNVVAVNRYLCCLRETSEIMLTNATYIKNYSAKIVETIERMRSVVMANAIFRSLFGKIVHQAPAA